MIEPRFFPSPEPLDLDRLLAITGATVASGAGEGLGITGVGPIDAAGPHDLTFLDNPAYAASLAASRAGACLLAPKFRDRAPANALVLVSPEPYRAFARVAAALYPHAARPQPIFGQGVAPGAVVHPDARLEADVTIDPGAVVGPRAEIGRGAVICANAVIGPEVRIGRDSTVGPGATIVHALVGDRVIVHQGARIGQDGFGFAMGPGGHLKVPQIGRVVIQDDVEIGANTTIDRGANRDTVIGEGTKIDNLVQIAHNVVIGRHCVIVSQVGISGSVTLEDFVVLGGHVGVVGHVRIGMGAQIAGSSNVREDVPPGARWGGTPAKPVRDWFREMTTLKRIASEGRTRPASDASEGSEQ
ncbi:UDP-3-O-[3-hydroxymyristoyl] glucosamine N-acyltransferase [Methylopila capsulata]|uniref:UDP-3-O-acylglucosamine N-acyltransferase n=1 Tax=Methylopila capsulata TaxID=61654 RepID=A0A9W6IRK7_9HYPH|nr:UDP-3-O-(3-hydroxymyristoyl)glucosamine N-acyltransferase [Methylopila capsulata]MBM7849913.1 UDP-3-O-[3-hydroxymyristoyl] glucosamine N-acyltransferase [Methylopila capsulata]GLK55203.1 UDP-3-O-acylglucosamine N-acyltransferase [Methylopila capsulata]